MAGNARLPVAVVGAGPVGLTTALGLAHYRIPFILLEEDAGFSTDTKAGTVLTRTLEVWHRYGCVDDVLAAALRIDEIGEIERATNARKPSVRLHELVHDTRFPFVVNIPQHHVEPLLAAAVRLTGAGEVLTRHRLESFAVKDDRVILHVSTPDGQCELAVSHLLACDGGRSIVREQLGATVAGTTLPERYMLIDVEVDLDVAHPRDYPYLAYFADPDEWMVLIRQPHCWRFLYPLPEDRDPPGDGELLARVRRFIGDVERVEVRGSVVYQVHHRVADRWAHEPFFLINRAIALRGTEMYDRIADPLPPADVSTEDGAAYAVLREARRDYRVPDPRVEALWTAWSEIGGEVSERKENRLPFLAQAIAAASRSLRGTDADPRALLGRLRRWRNDLPQLFLAFLNFGLVLADTNPPDLAARLDTELRALVDEYDTTHLGAPFEDYVAQVEKACGPVAAAGKGRAA